MMTKMKVVVVGGGDDDDDDDDGDDDDISTGRASSRLDKILPRAKLGLLAPTFLRQQKASQHLPSRATKPTQ